MVCVRVRDLVCVRECVCFTTHLPQLIVVDKLRSVSVDQSVEGQTILPAVGDKRQKTPTRQIGRHQSSTAGTVGKPSFYIHNHLPNILMDFIPPSH